MNKSTWDEAFHKKIVPPENLRDWADSLKRQGIAIATLNGSFDLMHAGHLEIIFRASKAADKLIVLLNSDSSIKQYKGSSRPIIPLKHRLSMMAALGFVDYVSWFEEINPIRVLSEIRPNVHVNGSEYGEDCIEAETVKAHGGRLEIVPLIPGLSTSEILKKIEANAPARRN